MHSGVIFETKLLPLSNIIATQVKTVLVRPIGVDGVALQHRDRVDGTVRLRVMLLEVLDIVFGTPSPFDTWCTDLAAVLEVKGTSQELDVALIRFIAEAVVVQP